MRNILIISIGLICIALMSYCTQSIASENSVPLKQPYIVHVNMDSIQGQLKFECDSALNVRDMQYTALRDSFIKATSYNCKEDSLRKALFIAKYKIEGVKKYLKICDKNPSQIKFLRGWIHRAID